MSFTGALRDDRKKNKSTATIATLAIEVDRNCFESIIQKKKKKKSRRKTTFSFSYHDIQDIVHGCRDKRWNASLVLRVCACVRGSVCVDRDVYILPTLYLAM